MSSLYGFAYSQKALDYLQTLQSKLRKQIITKIYGLAALPLGPGCKMLQGMLDGEERVYRIRSGDYRILYVVRGPLVVVLDIDHRKDVYR